MEYIIRLKDKLSQNQKEIIEGLVSEVIYESKLLPLLGVRTNNADLIEKLDFVNYIRLSEEGTFQDGDFLSTVIFEPKIRKSLLINNQLTGWGDTRVFVLDSGVNNSVSVVEHKDFTGTGTTDLRNHGTVVAEIIKHLAKGATLYSGKVGNETPNELYLMKALEWALDKGASIINVSAGFRRKKPCNGTCDLCALVNAVASKGVAVVVAAGNRGPANNTIDCPGEAVDAITVGAIDQHYKVAEYSSVGRPGGLKPNLVAPGRIYINGCIYQGTSFAAPVVSGILAAILNKVGNVSKAREYIYNTLDDLGLPRHCQGLGCLNLDRLVEVIVNETINTKGSRQGQSS